MDLVTGAHEKGEFPATEGTILTPEEEDDIQSGYVPEPDDTPLRVAPPDRRLVTQPYDLVIRTIIAQIEDGSLVVSPPYQRGYVWDDGRASRLIESLLMNIPIPACYFAEDEGGTLAVIDGQQRLQSIWRFVRNHFRLRGLRTLVEFQGKFFKDLNERSQRIILGRTIRCIVITQESHPEIRFDVFERLNTGAVHATDQEIRNAIYRGDLNLLIKDLSESQKWLSVLGKTRPDKRMRDDELVLRLFAVHDNYLNYQAPLRTFLNEYAASRRGDLPAVEKARLISIFHETVDKVMAVFNGHAFRIRGEMGWERQMNRALFDAVVLVFSRIDRENLAAKRSEIEDKLIDLFSNYAFMESITRSTGDTASFSRRIEMFSRAMAEIELDSGIHREIETARLR